MSGVNKVIILGNIGNDPDIKYTASGDAIANLSVATSESWKDQSGQRQEKTEWHRVVMYKRLAEIVQQYVKKGSKIYIEGKLQTRKWQDQNGQDRYTTEIVGREMQMLDSKSEADTAPYKSTNSDSGGKQFNPETNATNDGSFDDDIPF